MMRFLVVIIFAMNGISIAYAQVYFSEIYNSTFVGPENLVSDHADIHIHYCKELKSKITDLEEYLESPRKANPNLALAKYPKLTDENVKADLKGLQSLLLKWKNEHSQTLENKNKGTSTIIYYETHEAKRPPFKRYVMREGKVDTIVIDDRNVWRKHTPRPKNCLSADPNDCLLVYLRFYKFYDSNWTEIPTHFLADNYLQTTFDKEAKILSFKKELMIR